MRFGSSLCNEKTKPRSNSVQEFIFQSLRSINDKNHNTISKSKLAIYFLFHKYKYSSQFCSSSVRNVSRETNFQRDREYEKKKRFPVWSNIKGCALLLMFKLNNSASQELNILSLNSNLLTLRVAVSCHNEVSAPILPMRQQSSDLINILKNSLSLHFTLNNTVKDTIWVQSKRCDYAYDSDYD